MHDRIPTPRPTFDLPVRITSETAVQHVWGDELSGKVYDSIIVSSQEIHVLEFLLPARQRFMQSPTNPTIFDADVCYVVLEGTLWIRNPESGETRSLEAGEALWIRPRTWHQAFNPSSTQVRVCEFFSPPPARGTASVFARQQPFLETTRVLTDRAESWPDGYSDVVADPRLVPLPREKLMWSFGEDNAQIREGLALVTRDLRLSLLEIDSPAKQTWVFEEDSAYLCLSPLALITNYRGISATHAMSSGDYLFAPAGTRVECDYDSGEHRDSTIRLWRAVGSTESVAQVGATHGVK
jgi:hypothetical protein